MIPQKRTGRSVTFNVIAKMGSVRGKQYRPVGFVAGPRQELKIVCVDKKRGEITVG